MVFGKDQNSTVEGIKGGKTTSEKYGSHFRKLWSNPEWVKRKRKQSSELLKKFRNSLSKEEYSKHCSRAGKRSRIRENIIAEKIKPNYNKFFIPSSVCDRIAIKDNKIIFIEIKKTWKEKLRPKQKEFKELCKQLNIEYQVHYYK